MELIQELKEAREAIWLSKPEEIKRVRARLGPRDQNFTIMSYAAGDTRGVIDFLHAVRSTAKAGETDLKSVVSITAFYLEFQASRYVRYYDMTDLADVIKKTVSGIKQAESISRFVEIMEAFALYIGKMYFWLDLELPWKELADEYEKVKALQE